MTKEESNALKGIAIIMLLLHHSFAFPDRYEGFQIVTFFLSEADLNKIADFCKITVSMFAFVSGYGLSAQAAHTEDADLPTVLGRRCKNLILSFAPVAAVCMVAMELTYGGVTAACFQEGVVNGVIYVLLNLCGIYNLFGTPSVCDEWWYMSAALVFILSAPFWRKAICRYRALPLVALVLLPRILGIGSLGGTSVLTFTMPFVLGVYFQTCQVFSAIDRVVDKIGSACRLFPIVLALFLMVASYQLYIHMTSTLYNLRYGGVPLLFIVACRIIFCQFRLLRSGFAFVGKYSSNMYYIHSVLLYKLFPDFFYRQRWCGLTVIWLFAITLVISILIEQLRSRCRAHKRTRKQC